MKKKKKKRTERHTHTHTELCFLSNKESRADLLRSLLLIFLVLAEFDGRLHDSKMSQLYFCPILLALCLSICLCVFLSLGPKWWNALLNFLSKGNSLGTYIKRTGEFDFGL